MSKLSVKFSCGNLFCVALLPCLGALAGVPLEVGKSGASIVGSTAEYEDVVLHGDYVIGEGAAVTNVGALLDIGPDAGDDATLTVRDGGQYVGVGGEQSSRRRIVIGRNGGRGKIVVSDVKQRDKPSWNVNDSRFSSEEWNLSLSAEADASSDTMDIVRIDTNAFFSIWCVSNYNTAVKARILFNGGTYYQRHRCSVSFGPVIGSEIIPGTGDVQIQVADREHDELGFAVEDGTLGHQTLQGIMKGLPHAYRHLPGRLLHRLVMFHLVLSTHG